MRMAQTVGRPDLLHDPRFVSFEQRLAHKQDLFAALDQAFRTRSTSQWLDELESAGVPCAPVNSIAQALKDPQVMARDMVFALEHETLGTVTPCGSPIKSAGLRTSGRTLLPSVRTPARFLPRCSATTMPGSVPWRPTASLRAEGAPVRTTWTVGEIGC